MSYIKALIAVLSIAIVIAGYYIINPKKNCSSGNTIVILPEQEDQNELTPFEREFRFQRDMLGPNMTFEWKNNKYTTNLKGENNAKY